MKEVNPYYLHVAINPLAGLADDDESVDEFANVDVNSPEAVKRIIRELIKPYLESIDPVGYAKVKLAFQYFLSEEISSIRFDRVFNSLLPPFNPPNDPRDLFVWIWEVCWPNESYRLTDLSQYHVVADIEAPNRDVRVQRG